MKFCRFYIGNAEHTKFKNNYEININISKYMQILVLITVLQITIFKFYIFQYILFFLFKNVIQINQVFFSLKQILFISLDSIKIKNKLFIQLSSFPWFNQYQYSYIIILQNRIRLQKPKNQMNFTYMHCIKIVFVVLGLIITEIISDLQYTLYIKSPNCGGCAFFSFHADMNNLAIIRKQGTNKVSFGFQDSQYAIMSVKANFVPFTSFQIRTSYLNQNSNASSYLVFNSTFAFEFPSQQTIYAVSAFESIVDSVYGQTLLQNFVLTRFSQPNTKYKLNHLFNGSLTVNFELTILGTTPFIRMVYRNGSIFLNFQGIIQVLAFNNNFSLIYEDNYRCNFANTTDFSKVDIDVQQLGSAFCYTTPTSLFLVSLPNLAVTQLKFIQNLGLNSNQIITSVRFALYRYIVLSTNVSLYQYDLNLGKMINETSLYQSGNFTIFYLNSDQSTGVIFLIPITNTPYSIIYEYSITTDYFCKIDGTTPNGSQACNSCLQNYILDQNNLNCFIPATPVIPNNNTSTTNTTVNKTEISSFQSQEVIISTKGQLKPNFLNSETARTISSALGQTLSLSSLRITPKFLLAFVCFLDDLWYYQYHRKQYPVVVTYAFANVDIANDIRFDSWVTSILKSITQSLANENMFAIQNQQFQNELQFSDSDPDVYFSYSSRQFYRFNILQCFLFYCILKIFQMIFQQLKNKARIFAQLNIALKNATRWWSILVTLIECNIVRLTFYSSLQFKIPISYDFNCKVNLVGNVFLFFVLFIYPLCFYLLVYAWQTIKQPAEELLARSYYNFKSFLLQPYYLINRGLIRAIIHGFFIQNYQLQISLLFFIDLLTIPFIIKIRKFFLSRFTLAFTLCYSVSFAAFDLYFVIESHSNLQQMLSNSRETVGLIFLCFLFGFTVLIALSLLVLGICYFVKLIYKRLIMNQISPDDLSKPTLKDKYFNNKKRSRKIIIQPIKHKRNAVANQNSLIQPFQLQVCNEQIKTTRKGCDLNDKFKIVEKMQNQIRKTRHKVKNQKNNKIITFLNRMRPA